MRDPGSPGNTTPQRTAPAPVAPKPKANPYVAPKKSAPKKTSSSSNSKAAAPAAAGPAINQNELAQQYGFTMGLLNAYPELKALFNSAVKETWSADKFQAKVRDSTWYKSMSDTERKYILLQATDPATSTKNWGTANDHVRGLIAQMGGDTNNWNYIFELSYNVQAKGWSDEQLRNNIGQYLTFGPNSQIGGLAGQTVQNLNTYAYQMGIQNSDQWTQDRVRNIVRGMSTEQDSKTEIMNQAAATYGQYAAQIRAGSTVQDLAQPYMQSMQQILEINPGSINLFDPTIKKAMGYKDPTGLQTAKPLWEFQNDLRTDDRWKKTQNAQDAAMGTAHKVLQDFGVAT